MLITIRAGFVYFAIVLGIGFALGVVRVPFLVPRIGERWAELMEMPIMAATIFFAAGYILRRFPEIHLRARALVFGLLVLALAVCAELGLQFSSKVRLSPSTLVAGTRSLVLSTS
jgi:hypothetical protein